jgi:integrase
MTDSHLTDSGSTRKRHVPTKHDHIYRSQRADGSWVYEVRVPHGNRSYEVVGPNLTDAKARANALYAPNAPKVTGHVTFEDAVNDWRGTRNMAPSSVKRLDGVLDRHVLPKIGRVKVRDIDTRTYRTVLATVTPGSAKLTYACMRIVLNHAVDEMGALAVVPKFPKGQAPKAAESRKRFLSGDEQTRLLMYAKRRGVLSQVIRVALGQALRIGEVVGLEWDDIDFVGGKVTIRRSVDGGGNVGTTKGKRERVLDLMPLARDALLELRGSSDYEGGRVFRNRDGNPWAYSDISRAFDAARDAAALQVTEDGKIVFHSLRHTSISRLAMAGVPLPYVQAFAGHADLATTQGYVHNIPSETVTAAAAAALAA